MHCLSEDCAKANLDDFLETRGVDNDTIVYFGYNLIWTSHKEKRQDEFGIAIGRSRDKVKNNMIQHSKRLMSINIVFHCCKIRMISGYALTEKKNAVSEKEIFYKGLNKFYILEIMYEMEPRLLIPFVNLSLRKLLGVITFGEGMTMILTEI